MQSHGKALLIVVLIVLALALVVGVSAVLLVDGDKVLSRRTILELDLTQSFPEHVPEDAFARSFLDGRLRLRRVVEAIERAATDDDVLGIVARTGAAPIGLATAQELRDAIVAFRDSGKATIAFADTFGEWGPSNGGYFLASAFERIYLQPSGDVGLSGLSYEIPFIAEALERIGLAPRLDGRHEYKNAINTYTEREFTGPHREAMQALVDSQFDQLVEAIAEGRDLEPDAVREIFDKGPYFGAESTAAGLIDELAYRDEVYTELEGEFGEDVTFTDFATYARNPLRGFATGRTVALIYGVGGVVRGESEYDPLSGMLMGSETVAKAFRTAIEDPDVEAILFRVNSPGGSYVASDTIWRETVRARDAGKPVVVSMGDMAASGGYFVSMSADRIVAQPGTITGSIGVYGGKMVSEGLWQKLGVRWGAVQSSDNARMWSSLDDFGDRGWERVQDSLDRIYDDFVSKVTRGRNLEREAVEQVAKGRVWTGRDALERGLVDRLGGYPVAREELRTLLELEDGESIRLELFPRPRSTVELFLERFSTVAAGGSAEQALRRLARFAERLGTVMRPLGLADDGPMPLRDPALEVVP